jgi:hypothetical protein
MFEHGQRTIVNHDIGSGAEFGLGLGKGSNDILLFRYVCLGREGSPLGRVAARTRDDSDL